MGQNRLFRRNAALTLAVCERLERRMVLSAPPLPIIPSGTFLVTSYGAVGDGTTDNTSAITNAIAAAAGSANHGGTVEIPAAGLPYLCGPIALSSNINFQVDSGATLKALPFGTYPNSMTSPANFITISGKTNVEISGSGIIDGQGQAWWTAYNNQTITNRPRIINASSSNTLEFVGVNIQNSPQFNVAFSNTSNVTCNGLNISNPSTSPNTDGIDPAGSHYLIENCTISTGDDDIAIKPQSVLCTDITITNMTINTGHGLSVGGETNVGLNGLFVSNITFNGTTSGIRLKAGRTTGGLVQNCTYTNITMTNVEYPININSYYPHTIPPNNNLTDPAQTVTSTTPIWQNITISNLTATIKTTDSNYSNSQCGVIWGLPEEPVKNVTFSNVQLQGKYGMDLVHVRGVMFDSNCTLTALGGGPDEIADTAASVPFDAVVTAAGWTDQDVGSPTIAGNSIFDPDTGNWTLVGAGSGFGSTSDQFNFASTPHLGDGGLVAKVNSQTNTNASAPVGVAIRESAGATAAFAQVVTTPSSGVVFEWRSSDGGMIQSSAVAGAAPSYVKITRQGSSFAGYFSSNGTTWTQIGLPQMVTMSSSALEGFVDSSNNATTLSTGVFTNINTGPIVSANAAANANPVPGTTTNLSVLGTDVLGASALTYTWSASGPAAVSYTGATNGTTAAANITANFVQAGSYTLTATITDSQGLATTSSIGVTVNQTLSTITVSPASPGINENGTQQFSAVAYDQFNNPMASQPAFAWSIQSGIGSIDSTSGLYTAPGSAGGATVKAASGSISGTASVTVTNAAPTVAQAAAGDSNPVNGISVTLSVLGADDGGEPNLTYTWSSTGPGGVTYSGAVNGTNAAKDITATFNQAGGYSFTVTIKDAEGLTVMSNAPIGVNQTDTSISVGPSNITLPINSTYQFLASDTDQFGNAIASPSVSWSVTGDDNSIDQSGNLTLGPTPGVYTVTADVNGVQGTSTVTTLAPPTITSFFINDGANPQRSLVQSVTVTFSEPVTLADGAITLTGQASAGGAYTPQDFNLTNPSGDLQTYVLTFTAPGDQGSSLPNGLYQLSVSAAGVQNAAGGTLAGGDQTFNFYRLFGDFDGSGKVGFGSLVAIIQNFNKPTTPSDYYLDANGGPSINFGDLVLIVQSFNKGVAQL